MDLRPKLHAHLSAIKHRLFVAHATCVTVRVALRAPGAERFPQIALCLCWTVEDALSIACDEIDALLRSPADGSPASPAGRASGARGVGGAS